MSKEYKEKQKIATTKLKSIKTKEKNNYKVQMYSSMYCILDNYLEQLSEEEKKKQEDRVNEIKEFCNKQKKKAQKKADL